MLCCAELCCALSLKWALHQTAWSWAPATVLVVVLSPHSVASLRPFIDAFHFHHLRLPDARCLASKFKHGSHATLDRLDPDPTAIIILAVKSSLDIHDYHIRMAFLYVTTDLTGSQSLRPSSHC